MNTYAGPSEFPRDDIDADLTPTLEILRGGQTLTADQTTRAFEAIMTGHAHHAEVGALLALLAIRVPTPDELVGAARVMRAHVDSLSTTVPADDLLDTAGTGGAPKTFNVSTAAAIVAAGAGINVAKHGNRSRTGRGSAEVLAKLGVDVDADRTVQARCLEEAGVCFCFAIHHHPAARHAMPVRKALGFPTIFNLLGPLTNPAGAKRQLMGVYDDVFVRPIAEALAALGARRAMVVHSDDGLDEISIGAPTSMAIVDGGQVREDRLDPRDLGIAPVTVEQLAARDLDDAAAIIRAVLTGAERGPARDMTLINAAAALVVCGHVSSFADGMGEAAGAVDSGAASRALEKLVAVSNAR